MLCYKGNVIQLLITLMEIESVKLTVIVKEMFYICHLPMLTKSFPKNMHMHG